MARNVWVLSQDGTGQFYLLQSNQDGREWSFDGAHIAEEAGATSQTISPIGHKLGFKFGTPRLDPVTLFPAGHSVGFKFGSPSVESVLNPAGFTTGMAFGSPTVTHVITPAGFAAGFKFGAPDLSLRTLVPEGHKLGFKFGTPTIGFTPRLGGHGNFWLAIGQH